MTMKWLTRERASGSLDDDEWDERWRKYLAHNAEVLPRLTNGAERLAQEINLHDAQIHSFEYRPNDVLVIRALIGDLQIGYQFVELSFLDSEIRLEPGSTIDSLCLHEAQTEIIYDEVDLEADGRSVHRVLLWPQGEYEVVFTNLTERRELASPSDRR
ncbi:hypothetical protein [Agromyces ramosus]|uniref:hypothetical protein n=1 Tax=Agromyces ramosus TaxID=33879 RepID=UPI0027D771FA|nr:hypothetical protein [Agromyces ramosus]